MEYISTRVAEMHQGEIRALFDKAQGLSDVISFGIGEPDMDSPAEIVEAGSQALAQGKTHYTANAGIMELREAIAAKARQSGIHVDARNCIVTPGGMGALALSILCTVNEGDDVMVQDPAWLNYLGQIQLVGAKPIFVPTCEDDGFKLTVEQLERHVTPKTRLLIINTPNNPTGSVLEQSELMEIADFVKRHDLLVIFDEVYDSFMHRGKHESIATIDGMTERTIIVNSFSKSFAMTGWRVGYAIAHEAIIAKMTVLQENMFSCVNASAQHAALYALQNPGLQHPMLEEYAKRLEFMRSELSTIQKLSYFDPSGSFYIFLNIKKTGLTSSEFAYNLLSKKHVVVIPGSAFGSCGEGYVRIAYTLPINKLREGMARIREYVEELL
jgi:aminotransferase